MNTEIEPEEAAMREATRALLTSEGYQSYSEADLTSGVHRLTAEAVIEAYNEARPSPTAVSETEDEGLESRAALTSKLHHAIGGRLDAEEALATVSDALREVLEAHSDNSGAEPSRSVFDRAIDEAREVLAALSRAGGR